MGLVWRKSGSVGREATGGPSVAQRIGIASRRTVFIFFLQCHMAIGQEFFLTSQAGAALRAMPWRWLSSSEVSDLELVIETTEKHQTMLGFGAAFTEASALNFKGLSETQQEHVIEMYFGEEGQGLAMGRIPINSCDFSPHSYTFDDVEDDFALTHFDKTLKHDRESGMIGLALRAAKKAKEAGRELRFFGSPWSPPKWMKNDNHDMVGSEKPCLKKDGKYHEAWARYISVWISAYRHAGVDIFGITAQNEPGFFWNTDWEACSYTPEQQRDFIRDYLGPRLEHDFGKGAIKIIMFDWNKDALEDYTSIVLGDAHARAYVWGVGLHWYSGDHFDKVAAVRSKFSGQTILGTEACNCEYDDKMYPDDWSRAMRYAHDMVGDFVNDVVGWTDWNLLLGVEPGHSGAGGPNHAGNMCYAQVHVVDGQPVLKPTFYVFGQFSRFIPPRSLRLGHSFVGGGGIEAFVAKRPDGKLAAVLLNRGGTEVRLAVRTSTASSARLGVSLPAQSVATVVFSEHDKATSAAKRAEPRSGTLWRPAPELGAGTYTIMNAASGRRMYAVWWADNERGVGATRQFAGSREHKWRIVPVPKHTGMYIIYNDASGRHLYATKGHNATAGFGARKDRDTFQYWTFKRQGRTDTYEIVNADSGRKLYAEVGKDSSDGVGALQTPHAGAGSTVQPDADNRAMELKWRIIGTAQLPKPGTTVLLRGGFSGMYCFVQASGAIKCNTSRRATATARFRMHNYGLRGFFAISRGVGAGMRYCSGNEGPIICNAKKIGAQERFRLVDAGDGKIGMKGGAKEVYCGEDRNHLVRCDRERAGPYEQFSFECIADCGGTAPNQAESKVLADGGTLDVGLDLAMGVPVATTTARFSSAALALAASVGVCVVARLALSRRAARAADKDTEDVALAVSLEPCVARPEVRMAHIEFGEEPVLE
mmetsp:Transcript_86486/g.242095  ORF Transcript_86486/g.242095 Transcript_86486/m.242095 type:complete len:932 (+) Transcript_86486:101-2896(+)